MHLPVGLPALVPGRKMIVDVAPEIEPEIEGTALHEVSPFFIKGAGTKGIFEEGEILDRIDRRA